MKNLELTDEERDVIVRSLQLMEKELQRSLLYSGRQRGQEKRLALIARTISKLYENQTGES